MSKLAEFCYKDKASIAIKFSFLGLGEGGGKITDGFAALKNSEGKPYYNTVAINSYKGDLDLLKNIPANKKFALHGGEGCGRRPEYCVDLLKNPDNTNEIKLLIRENFMDSDFIVIVIGFGGGTGTGLFLPALKYIHEEINKPLIAAGKKPKPVGAIITLPRETDPIIEKRNSVKVLEPLKAYLTNGALRFVRFVDNKKAYNDYKNSEIIRSMYSNWMDYTNSETVNTLHEINVGITNPSERVFDPKDFKNIFQDDPGCITLSKIVLDKNSVRGREDLLKKLEECLKGKDTNEMTEGYDIANATHAGFLLVKPKDKDSELSKDLHDDIDIRMNSLLPYALTRPGSCFNWKLDTDSTYVIYTITKITDFPIRAGTGLQDEVNEKTKELNERKATQKIATADINFDDEIFKTSEMNIFVEDTNPFGNNDNQSNNDEIKNMYDELLNSGF